MSAETCRIRLHTLGPVFVGSGQEINKSEYIQDALMGRIYVMDTLKMFNGLKKLNLLDTFEEYMLSDKQSSLTDFVRKYKLDATDYGGWASYTYAVSPDTSGKNNKISACIKDAYNMPYIPGSTLKGALRGALTDALIASNRPRFSEISGAAEKSINNFRFRNRYLADESRDIDVELFHRDNMPDTEGHKKPLSDASYSVFRGLSISDSKPLTPEDMILCAKLDIFPGGQENKVSALRECIRPGTVIEFDVTIDTAVFRYSIEKLKKAIVKAYSDYYRRYLSKFTGTEKQKGCILYVGGGSGFHTKSVVSALYEDEQTAYVNTGKILENTSAKNMGNAGKHRNDYERYSLSPRVRKCTRYNNKVYDMGMCRVEFVPC